MAIIYLISLLHLIPRMYQAREAGACMTASVPRETSLNAHSDVEMPD